MKLYVHGGENMETGIEDIIKSVIHIDRGACHMKEEVDKQIDERRRMISEEIGQLKQSIVEERREAAYEKKRLVLEGARNMSEGIIAKADKKAEDMQRIFNKEQQEFVEQMFREIFLNQQSR